jgi:acyl-CoA reductase-like NAD-dependent aldehyde dehydrogenase
MAEIANEVFPPGLVQCLGGDDKLGPTLVDHPNIHKISFTGSTATGKRVMASAARTLKRVTLELGGNDPAIVLPDANIAKVAPMVALVSTSHSSMLTWKGPSRANNRQGAFANTSQFCVATKRIYVHSSIYKPFLSELTRIAQSLKTGHWSDEDVKLGPIQNSMQFETVKSFFRDTKEHGYKFVLGSGDVQDSEGYFIQPAIIDDPPDDSMVVRGEPFGPIVPVQKYDTIDEVIQRANNSKVGLGATVFGTDQKLLQDVADALEVGNVWINHYGTISPEAPFGGVKESGMGTEFGTLGILAYANVKAVTYFKTG